MNGRKTKFSENQIKFILMRLKQGYGVNEIARGFKDGLFGQKVTQEVRR